MRDNLNLKLNTCYTQNLTVIPPQRTIVCKADTGASKTYIKPTDKDILQSPIKIRNGPNVNVPNGATMTTTEIGIVPIHQLLSKAAQQANVLEGLSSASLISIGQLCDDDCIAIFDKRSLKIYKHNTLVLTGKRNWTDGLWDIFLPRDPKQQINVIIRRDKTKQELAEYLHKCAFSPSITTFQKAIRRGHFITWPGIGLTTNCNTRLI